MTKCILPVALALCLLTSSESARAGEVETIDKIAVVVGDEVILASELASQIQLVAFQTGHRPQTEKEIKKFQKQILEQMISDRLFLIEAKKDTTINIRPEEIRQALDEHISGVASNFESQDEFLSALAVEGMTLRDLERRYEKDIANNLLRQRYIQNKLYDVSVSRFEVDKFYGEFKDSIPNQPEAMKLAHILFKVKPSEALEDSVAAIAADLRQKVLDGADFATISSRYSTPPAGTNGGDLGYIDREDVVPEFARAAFKLSPGDISGVIRTPFGFHVIKCEGKRGERLKLRHILLSVQPSSADTVRTMDLIDSLLTELNNGADFAEVAKVFSQDDESRAQGGELGWFATSQLPVEFATALAGWKTPGETRGPVSSQFGLHLIKLLDYQPEKKLSLDEDYDRIRELARQDKTGKQVDEWISELKNKTYIDYRMEDLN